MEIFLSAELGGPASNKWFELQKEFSPLLSRLRDLNYGESLKSIGIISILMPDDFYVDGGYKERKYYNKKKKEADIRLRMDYKKFLLASRTDRRRLYISHILDAIRIAGVLAGVEFNYEQLMEDVELVLSI